MKYLFLFFLNFLMLNLNAQQGALDSIAVKIQTYINHNKIPLKGWFEFGYANDSLHIGSAMNFIRSLDFDKSSLKDSAVYHLKVVKLPVVDTVIVDIAPLGWKLGEAVFGPNEVYGEFKGGQVAFNKRLLKFIKDSGYILDGVVNFELYFDNSKPNNLVHIQSENKKVARLIEQFYLANNKTIFIPPIFFGVGMFSSIKFKIWDEGENQKSFDFVQEVNEYFNLIISEQHIYTISVLKNEDSCDSILVYDRKNNIENHVTSGFLSQFSEEHHPFIQDLVLGLKRKDGVISNIMKIKILDIEK